MNFLELAQRFRREGGISGNGPSSVLSQAGEMQSVVEWTNEGWADIQGSHATWKWMYRRAYFNTVIGQDQYPVTSVIDEATEAALTGLGHWWKDTASMYELALGRSDEKPLGWKSYEVWRASHDIGAPPPNNRPQIMVVENSGAIRLTPAPDKVYRVRIDYQQAPYKMAANADIPAMPEQFHMAIVWRALMLYGEHEAAIEMLAKGQKNFNRLMSRLETNQLPDLEEGLPLVE